MLLRPFNDEYAAVGRLLQCSADDLRAADAQSQPLRWVAWHDDSVIGVANARTRPDGRIFMNFGGSPSSVLARLASAAIAEIGPVHALARTRAQRADLENAGFIVAGVDDEFEIAFDLALQRLGRPRLPTRFEMHSPHLLDQVRLAALDTELRQDVPGTDGWLTTVEMWEAELGSPEYDPTGYLVGVEKATDEYHGLVRFWRNQDAPRLGLLAVSPIHRGSLLAAALLRQAVEGASHWGSPTFRTSTSPSNRGTYPALMRLGAAPMGRRYQMVRRS